MKVLSEMLKSYSERKDLNREELAKKIGIKKSKLSRVINCKTVDGETIIKIQHWIFK